MGSAIAIWWIKRDIRLSDNLALKAAISSGLPVLPLFCFEPSICTAPDTSEMHLHAQTEALSDLRNSLINCGAELYVSHEEVLATLARIHASRRIGLIVAHEEIGASLSYNRDLAVAKWCNENTVSFREYPQTGVKRGGINRDKREVFWRERILGEPPLPPVTRVPMTNGMRESAAATRLPSLRVVANWQTVSETAAHATLTTFLNARGLRYRGGTSSPNSSFDAGSRLSVHLAWGTLTARQVYQFTVARLKELKIVTHPEANRWSASLRAFLSRIHWRDHFIQRLESEPAMEFHPLHPAFRDFSWENDPKLLDAWITGRTGLPLVDAVMRCLAATGFVNFRMRAMITSIACHTLHLDWRAIHPPLARVFRDYEPGIHLSQLQMQAGMVGLNTIRIYSPQKQLVDQDPDCNFVKRWVPELSAISTERIHAHLLQPIHADYPPPVVDWPTRAAQMRERLYALKSDPLHRVSTQAVFERHGSRRKQPQPKKKRVDNSETSRKTKQASKQLSLFKLSL